jgi:uncharacterized protein YbaP (TraB family)
LGSRLSQFLRRSANRLAILLSALCIGLGMGAGAADAGSPGLWQVTGPKGSLHIMGSVHVLTQSDSWMTRPINTAFLKSQCLALEIDLATIPAEQIGGALREAGQYPPDQGGLEQHVSGETYARFRDVAAKLAISPESLDRFRPWLVGLVLDSVITRALGYQDQYGVDVYFMNRAKASGLPTVGLESLEDQVKVLSESDGSTDDEVLTDVLDTLEKTPSLIKVLAGAWREGDMATIEKKVAEEFADMPEDYDRLIAQRNKHWLPELEKMLDTGRNCFIVVGAAHLVGNASVLKLLRQAGYTVTRQ